MKNPDRTMSTTGALNQKPHSDFICRTPFLSAAGARRFAFIVFGLVALLVMGDVQ